MVAKLEIAPFRGFPKELFQFLEELSANNNRYWFASQRERYERCYLEPSLAFIQAMQARLPRVSKQLTGVPKRTGGSLMRIYRDTRFSKDKTPYKTNIGIHFRHNRLSDIHAPGFYVHLANDECLVAAGVWLPPREALQLIRQTIDEDRAAWKKVLREKKFVDKFAFAGDSLKTAPRGFDPNHPLIEDLRRTSYCGTVLVKRSDVQRADFLDQCANLFLEARPLMKFLCDALGLPY
jgi:uncharacterized protein (TIGR02453 family)